MKEIICYHFTGRTLRNGDPIPKVGEWLKHKGPVVPCESGLHGSEDPFDALYYAPGSLLHKVVLRGKLKPNGNPVDKWVGSQRKILATRDSEKMLRRFACDCALSVIHLWNAPKVVVKYLTTCDEKLRAAAWGAAWAAARGASPAAAKAAAGAAAWGAAWGAAKAAAWGAAWDAARGAASCDARDTVQDATRKKQRLHFNELVDALFKEEM